MSVLSLRFRVSDSDRVRNRDRRRRGFVPLVDGLDKRIAPGGLLPPPPPGNTCDPAPPTS